MDVKNVLDCWTWAQDDDAAVDALLKLPRSVEHSNAVLRMCVHRNRLTAGTAALVRMYADPHDVSHTVRTRVLRVCVLALQFLKRHAFTVLDAIYRFEPDTQELMDACVACIDASYPFNVRSLAMLVVARMTSPLLSDTALYARFKQVADMVTSSSTTAPALLARIAGQNVTLLQKATTACAREGNFTRPAVDMALDLAKLQPALAVACGAVQIMLHAEHQLPRSVLMTCAESRPVRTRHELLVYLVKFGTVPPGAERIWAYVLSQCTVDVKVMYANLLNTAHLRPLPRPQLPAFCNQHVGCIRVFTADGTCVPVLLSLLARHATMFGRAFAWGQADTFHVQSTRSVVEKMRDLVYYFDNVDMAAYTLDDVRHLVALADMIGARAILHLVLHKMAILDFWVAWDMTHEWPGTADVLRLAAQQQLPTLVRCSRMREIALAVAGL